MTKELKALIEDLRLNHEFCPKEIILQAADELERLAQPEQEPLTYSKLCEQEPVQYKCTWVGLSDEEIQTVAKQARSKDHAVTLTNKFLREKNL